MHTSRLWHSFVAAYGGTADRHVVFSTACYPTRIRIISLGAPKTRILSMSPMRLGPAMKESMLGIRPDPPVVGSRSVCSRLARSYAAASFRRCRLCSFSLHRRYIIRAERLIDHDAQREFEIPLVHLPKGGNTDTATLVIGILYHKSATADSCGGLEALNKLLHSPVWKTDCRK